MSRLTLRQVILSVLVMAVFAPVFLAVGSPAFRPAWLSNPVIGEIPASALVELAYLALFVVLVWVFSGSAFAEDTDRDDGPKEDGPKEDGQ